MRKPVEVYTIMSGTTRLGETFHKYQRWWWRRNSGGVEPFCTKLQMIERVAHLCRVSVETIEFKKD